MTRETSAVISLLCGTRVGPLRNVKLELGVDSMSTRLDLAKLSLMDALDLA